MSIEAIKWAQDLNIPPSPKFVLVTLATYAGDTATCFPSFNTLSKKTSFPRRSIIRHIEYLISKNLLEKIQDDHHRSNLYKLNLSITKIKEKEAEKDEEVSDTVTPSIGDTMTPPKKQVVTPCHQGGDTMSPPSDTMSPSLVTPCHPNHQLSYQLTIIEPSILSPPAEVTQKMTQNKFEEFWKAYPRHEKKKNARDIWQRKKLNSKAEEIIRDVETRKEKHLQWKQGIIPHASTYLNGERWDDEIVTEQKSQAPPSQKMKTLAERNAEAVQEYLKQQGLENNLQNDRPTR